MAEPQFGVWQPMETAPMDGSEILIWTIFAEQDVAWWDGRGWCCGKEEDSGRSYYPGAKLWMPLPSPPKEGE